MKKTITITIAGTLFHIEEDAYERLSKYLESIKQHFNQNPEKDEIISDIESRIAEQFNEKHTGTEKIVNLKDIETLIKSMGNVEDFSDSESNQKNEGRESSPETKNVIKKKLFRNPDDVIIAGVASGIGAYFDIDPVVIRMIFVLVTVLGGSGVLIYIILWLIIPMAKTSTDKLQMRGEPITLESVNQVFKEKVEEVKKNKSTFRKIITFPFTIIRRVFEFIFPLLRKIISLLIIVGSVCALFGLITTFSTVVFNISSPYVDFPLMQLGHQSEVFIGLVALFLIAFIPLIFILFLGIRIFGKSKFVSNTFSISLLGIWFISMVTMIVIGTKLLPEYKNFVETSPLYAERTENYNVEAFNKVEIQDGNNVTIVESPEFKVTATGPNKDLQYLNVNVSDETLHLNQQEKFKICIFCRSGNPKITVYMPTVQKIDVSNGSRIKAELASTTEVTIKLSNASKLEMNALLKSLTLELSNGSWAEITGTSTTANFTLSNASRLDASDFKVKDANVQIENGSTVNANVSHILNVHARNGSRIEYIGNPKITKDLRNGSRIQENNFESEEDYTN